MTRSAVSRTAAQAFGAVLRRVGNELNIRDLDLSGALVDLAEPLGS
jgi:hypothetical protein